MDLDAKIEDITVGMQQRVEILKMLYRDNEVLIFDEPTAVLTPQEIEELMEIMRGLTREGKSILFISHKLNEIMEVSDRVTVLRKGRYVGTVETANTTKEELSRMMVGRPVQLVVDKDEAHPGQARAGGGASACALQALQAGRSQRRELHCPCRRDRVHRRASTATARPIWFMPSPGWKSPLTARSRWKATTSPMPPSASTARRA